MRDGRCPFRGPEAFRTPRGKLGRITPPSTRRVRRSATGKCLFIREADVRVVESVPRPFKDLFIDAEHVESQREEIRPDIVEEDVSRIAGMEADLRQDEGNPLRREHAPRSNQDVEVGSLGIDLQQIDTRYPVVGSEAVYRAQLHGLRANRVLGRDQGVRSRVGIGSTRQVERRLSNPAPKRQVVATDIGTPHEVSRQRVERAAGRLEAIEPCIRKRIAELVG